MNTFLWFLIVVALIEVGGAMGYLLTGVWPERTKVGIFTNMIFWACLSVWAVFLLK